MKRLSLLGLLALGATLVAGCPVFDDNPSGCGDNCGGTTTTSSTGTPFGCISQSECSGINETCGSDNQCHTGDCTIWGCASPQVCVVADQKASCQDAASGTGGAAGATGGASTGGASTGGASTGGASTGGNGGMGGASTGGASTGGTGGMGGASTGGASTGGASTGGASTGGASTGGASTGGASTGGTGGAGGAPQYKCPVGYLSGGLAKSGDACAINGTDDLTMCCDADQGLKCLTDVNGATCH